MDWITLSDFEVDCIVGILPKERVTPQPVQIAVSLGLDLQRAGDTGDLAASLDYAAVANELSFLLRRGHWWLIESFAMAGLRHLLLPPEAGQRAQVQRVELSIRKPTILGGQAVPGVRVRRDASWCQLERYSLREGVQAQTLVETEHTNAYRVYLSPGTVWRPTRPLALWPLVGDLAGVSQDAVMVEDAVRNEGGEEAALLAVARKLAS